MNWLLIVIYGCGVVISIQCGEDQIIYSNLWFVIGVIIGVDSGYLVILRFYFKIIYISIEIINISAIVRIIGGVII